MTERIPQEELDKAWRNLVRRVAALIVHAMAEADADYALIGYRLGKSADEVRGMLAEMIECTNKDILRVPSDLMCAMGLRVEVSICRPTLRAQAPAAETQD